MLEQSTFQVIVQPYSSLQSCVVILVEAGNKTCMANKSLPGKYRCVQYLEKALQENIMSHGIPRPSLSVPVGDKARGNMFCYCP